MKNSQNCDLLTKLVVSVFAVTLSKALETDLEVTEKINLANWNKQIYFDSGFVNYIILPDLAIVT